MMKRLYFLLLLLLTNCGYGGGKGETTYVESKPTYLNSIADTCEISQKYTITIACVGSCQKNNINALKEAAKFNHYKINFVRLDSLEDFKNKSFDSFLIEGGADINLDFYRNDWIDSFLTDDLANKINSHFTAEEKQSSYERDDLEIKILREYFKNDKYKSKTLLAICRGMQLLSVANNIPLYIDIPSQLGFDANNPFENISMIDDSSLLYQIFNGKNFQAKETHHQGLDYRYYLQNKDELSHIKVTATSNENRIAEAIEFTERNALGVQFHPENSSQSVRLPIFSWFLNKSCKSKL